MKIYLKIPASIRHAAIADLLDAFSMTESEAEGYVRLAENLAIRYQFSYDALTYFVDEISNTIARLNPDADSKPLLLESPFTSWRFFGGGSR